MNKSVKVSIISDESELEVIIKERIDICIITSIEYLDKVEHFNNICRKFNKKFIFCMINFISAYLFVDFGNSYMIENPLRRDQKCGKI